MMGIEIATRQADYFELHREELANEHHGEYAVIHNESVFGFYPSEREALIAATEGGGLTLGEFLVYPCLHKDEEPVIVI